MSKLLLCVGISNCGKSSWAKQYLERNKNAVELNRDVFRFNILKTNEDYDAANEECITELVTNQYNLNLEKGKDIIVSDTNLSYHYRNAWINRGLNNDQEVELVIFKSYFENLFYGSGSNAIMQLPDHVINSQYKRFTQFLEEPLNPRLSYTII